MLFHTSIQRSHNIMKKFGFIFFSLLAFLFLFFSCGISWTIRNNIEINEIGTYPQPLIEPLPLKIGVYYGNDFSKFETTNKIDLCDESMPECPVKRITNIKMGKANILLFDYILHHVFREVTLVQHFSEDPEDMKNLDLIIKPTIHKCSYNINISHCECSIHITYEISFYSPGGESIKPWLIEGSCSNVVDHYSESFSPDVIELMTQMAMRQVAAKFMTDFCNQEDIKKLFYSHCKQ